MKPIEQKIQPEIAEIAEFSSQCRLKQNADIDVLFCSTTLKRLYLLQ